MYRELLKSIGQYVRIRRKAQGLSILDLSHKSGVSFSTLSALENEHSNNISVKVLYELASALNTDFLSLVTPIISQDEYIISPNQFDEEDCINSIAKSDIKKTYYPPIMRHHQISSMLELAIILPLLNPNDLFDVHYRILGAAIGYEDYISEKFDWLWNSVPDSPSKRYVQKELDKIHSIRNGIDYVEDFIDTSNEELDALQETLENKRTFLTMLRDTINANCMFNTYNHKM